MNKSTQDCPSTNENEIWLFDGIVNGRKEKLLCIPTLDDCCSEIAHYDIEDKAWIHTSGMYGNYQFYEDMKGTWIKVQMPNIIEE